MQTEKLVVVKKKKFKVVSIPPTRSLTYYFTLQKLILGPIGELIQGAAGTALASGGDIKKIDVYSFLDKDLNFAGAFDRLASNIDPEKMTSLCKGLIEDGAQDEKGLPILFEEVFIGDMNTVFGLVKEVVAHNYPDFFGSILEIIGLEKEAKNPSTQAK